MCGSHRRIRREGSPRKEVIDLFPSPFTGPLDPEATHVVRLTYKRKGETEYVTTSASSQRVMIRHAEKDSVKVTVDGDDDAPAYEVLSVEDIYPDE